MDAPVLLRADAERREIGDRLRHRALEVVPVGPQLRHAQLPRSERVPHVLELLAEPALGRLRVDDLARRRRHDVDHELPPLARLQLDRVRRPGAFDETGLGRENDLRRGAAVVVGEQELACFRVERRLDEGRQLQAR